MKRCPECRLDYVGETLLYYLEDGAALAQGSVALSDEPETPILQGIASLSEAATRAQNHTIEQTAVLPSRIADIPKSKSFDKRLILAPLAVAVIISGVFFGYRYITPAKQIESIAVKSLANESGSADVESLSDEMTDTRFERSQRKPDSWNALI